MLDADVGSTSTPAAPALDALWAQLQQQHSLEAEAARLNRRSNSGALQTGSKSQADSSVTAAEQDVVQQAAGRDTTSRTVGRVDAVGARPVARLPTPATKEHMSEADFWQMMQK